MKTAKHRIMLLSIITLAFWMPNYFYLQVLPGYIQILGGSLAAVGIITGAYGISQIIFRIPLGIWSDRRGRKKPFIAGGIVLGILSNLFFLAAVSPAQLFWGQVLSGALATAWVVLTAYAAESFPENQTTRIMGIIYAACSISQLVAATSGAYMAQRWGMKSTFWAGVILGVVGLLLTVFLDKEPKTVKEPLQLRRLLAVGKEKPVMLASLLGILVQYGFWTIIGFSPVIAKNLGVSMGDMGLLSLSILSAVIGASYAVGWLTGVIGQRRTFIVSITILIIGLVLTPLAHNLGQLCLILAVFGIGRGLVFPCLLSLCQTGVEKGMKTTAMGFFQSIYAIGTSLGPALTGIISRRFSLAVGFYWCGFLMSLGLLLLWLAIWRREPADPN